MFVFLLDKFCILNIYDLFLVFPAACKRKEEIHVPVEHPPAPKKPRLVFTDLQRRTLQAIFKVLDVLRAEIIFF
jgi:hypothetical protein